MITDTMTPVPDARCVVQPAQVGVPSPRPKRLDQPCKQDEIWNILERLERDWAQSEGLAKPSVAEALMPPRDHFHAEPSARRDGLPMAQLMSVLVDAIPDLPDRATARALLAEAGHTVRIDAERRYLLSDAAVDAGVGRNVRPRDGFPFPVFYPESIPMIIRSFIWSSIKACMTLLASPDERKDYVARYHAYLPVKALAMLAGCSSRTIERALQTARGAAA